MKLPRFSLATRLTAAFVLAAAVCGSIAGLVLARTLLLGLDDGLDVSLRSRAQTLATQWKTATPDAFASQLAMVRKTSGLTQVLNPQGQVLAASGAAGTTPLLSGTAVTRASRGTFIIDADRALPVSAGSRGEDVEVRLLGAPLRNGDLVVVGSLRDTVSDAVNETVGHLFIAGVIGLVLVAIGARLLVGAALRPVETARRQVELASQDEASPVLVDPGGEDEFSRLVRTFNRLLSRQHELLQAERTFTADAGHELRTPLAILSGELELAARPTRTRDEVTLALSVAKDETDRLARLTEQLLMLARGDQRTLVARVPGDVAVVLRSAVTSVRPLAVEAGLTLEVRGLESVPASIDPDRLRLAVDNLLRNAIRFAPAGSTIFATLELESGFCRLRILDAGPGFIQDFLPHAFDRFRRDDAARGRGTDDAHGAGLGLAIVKAIVVAHGGSVSATNRGETSGAAVGFDLPVGSPGG